MARPCWWVVLHQLIFPDPKDSDAVFYQEKRDLLSSDPLGYLEVLKHDFIDSDGTYKS